VISGFLSHLFIAADRRNHNTKRTNWQASPLEGVEEDFRSPPRVGSAPDSVQFCMAVLHHIVDHSVTLKTSEVW